MANDIYSRIAAHNKEVRKNKKQKKSNDSLYERINQHNTYVRETQQNNNLTGTNQTGGVPAFQNNGILQRAAREMTQRMYNAQPKPIERISTELHPAGTRQLQSESLAEKHFNQVVKNTNQAVKDTGFANTSSYAERKQIIDKLRVNPYKGNLEKQISQYESGKEYLEDAKKRNETVTPDNFVKWMERNNRNLEDEAQNIYMKQGDDWSTAYDKSKNAVNSLKSADEKEKGWKEDKEKSGLLQVIANNNLETTKDYEAKMAEYQQRVDNAPVDKIGDIQREWLEKYDDKYLHQKHQELWDSLSEDERKEIMEQTELSTRLKYAGDASDKNNEYRPENNEYRPEYLEGADGTFYNRYAYDPEYLEKKQKELEKRYSKEDAENIMKYAQAYVNEEMLPIDLKIAREKANDSDVVTVLLDSAIKNLAGGVSGMTGAIGQRMGRTFGDESTIDWNNKSLRQMQSGQELRAEKGKNIDNKDIRDFYQSVGSGVDMLVASPILAVPLVGKKLFKAVLSSEAGASQMLDAHNRGLSDTVAVGEGLVAAMGEYGSETISLEMMLPEITKIGSLRNWLKHVSKSYVSEGSEEVVSGTLTELYDRMVAEDKSQYSLNVKKYVNQGMSEKEARQKADKDFLNQLGDEFDVGGMAGAMFGSVTGTGAYVMNHANTQTIINNGQQIINNGESENLINFAQNMREDSESFKKAQELGKKKKVSAEDIGELQQQVMAEISEEAGNNYGDVVNEAEVRLEQMGVEDVDTAKEAVANVLTSSQVTEEQIDMIENVPGVKEVLNSLTIDFPENTNASTAIATIRSMSEKVEKSAAEHIPDKPETVKADTKLPDAVKLSGTEIQSAVEDGSYHPTYSLQSSVTTPQGHGTIREIVHTGADNRQVIVDYDNGTSDLVTIDADNDYVDDEVEGALYSMANDMGYHGANALIRNANTDMFDSFDSIKAYSDNAKTIYMAGVNNASFESVYNGSSLALTMPEAVAYRFYNAGVMDRQNNQSVTRAEWNEKKKKSTQRRTTDKTDYYDIKNYKEINTAAVAERMSEGQKEEVTAVKKIAEVTGIKVKFFESKNVDGKLKGANGFFNPKTNEIWIDINAGRTVAGLGRTTMVKTLSHELTHWIKNQGGSLYADYEKAVMDYLTNARGISREELIQEKMDSFGGKISREAAVDEIVADASEMMLKDTNVLNEVAEKNQSWFQQVKDHVMEVIEKIRAAIQKAYSNVKATSAEAKILTELDGAMEDLQKMWDSALVEAGEIFKKYDYENTKDENFAKYISENKDKKDFSDKKNRYYILERNVPERLKKDIQKVLGIDVSGYKIVITGQRVHHINLGHGLEGSSDHSMGDLSELEHISYLFEHYNRFESGGLNYEYLGKDNKPSKTFILETDIDGETIVTIEAVQESKTKLIRVLTEYKKKTDKSLSTSKRTSADAQSELIESSTNSISQKEEDNNGIFSMRSDSEGRELTPQQQEFFKNSKIVDEDGNLQVMYHGTANEFTEFEPVKYGGKNGIAGGYGIYLSSKKDVSKLYGNNLMEVYVDVKKPAIEGEKKLRKADVKKIVKSICEKEANQMVEDEGYDDFDEAIRDTWISNYLDTYSQPIEDSYDEVADMIYKGNEDDVDIVQEIMSGNGANYSYEGAYDFYESLGNAVGIDGFVYPKEGTVIAFYSNQVKNVTNENPTDNPDIRFSMKIENEYKNAVEQDNYDKAKALVEQYAKSKGYTQKVYHGTEDFGFTKIDLGKSDDGFSFWATDDVNLAQTYSGVNDTRGINEEVGTDAESLFNQLVNSGIFKDNDLLEKGDLEGRMYELEVELGRLHRMQQESYYTLKEKGFSNNDYNQLDKLYNDMVAEYLLFKNASSGMEVAKKMKPYLEKLSNINYVISDNAQRALRLIETLDRLDEDLFYLDGIVRDTDYVRKIIKTGSGNYEMLANTENLMEIDAKGSNWNHIMYDYGPKEYSPEELVKMLEETGYYDSVSYSKENGNYLIAFNGTEKEYDEGYVKRVLKLTEEHKPNQRSIRTRDIAKDAYEKGYQGVKIKNVVDDGGRDMRGYSNPANVYIFFNPQQQLKSADPVTYDDNGNVISLKERFNAENNDIRFSARNGMTKNMDEGERADIIRKTSIEPVEVTKRIELPQFRRFNDFDKWVFNRYSGLFGKPYLFKNANVEAYLSKNTFRESAGWQRGPLNELVLAVENFAKLAETSEVIKVQEDRHAIPGEYNDVENYYILLGVMQRGEEKIPVKIELRENKNNNNSTRLLVTLDLIKKEDGVFSTPKETSSNGLPHSSSNYTIQSIIEEVKDGNFIKYIPDSNLSEEQLEIKKEALVHEINYDFEHNRMSQKEKQERIKRIENHYSNEPQFSMRNISEADYGTLLEERDYLKEQVELLRKEFEVTKGHSPKMEDIQRMGKKILKKYNSTYPIEDFNHNMKEILEFTKNSKVQNYSAVMNAMMKMGRKIAETSQEVDSSMYDQYAELRKALRTTRIMLNDVQKEAAAEQYGTYNDFRKKMMGKLRLVKEGIPLDEMWQQYAEMYPELFNKETGDADQVDELQDIITNISTKQVDVMGGMDVDNAARDIAQEIFQEYFDLPSVQTFADARIQELNEAREEYKEKLSEARKDYKARYDKKVYKDKIVRLRNNLAAKITQKKSVPLEIADKVIDVLNEIYRGNMNLGHVERVTQDALMNLGISESVAKKITDRCTITFLEDYNESVGRSENRLERWLAESELDLNKVEMRQIMNTVHDNYFSVAAVNKTEKALHKKLKVVQESYAKFKGQSYEWKSEYDERLDEHLKNIAEITEDKALVSLDNYQLERLYESLKEVSHIVINATNQVAQDRNEENMKIAQKVIDENGDVKQRSKSQKLAHSVNVYAEKYLLSDVRYVRSLTGYNEDSTLWKLYSELFDATRTYDKFKMDASKPFDALTSQKAEYDKFTGKAKGSLIENAFYDIHGKPVTISHSQLVQIIMSWERPQGRTHMEKGGLTVYDAKELLKGDLLKAKDNSRRTVNVTENGINQMRLKLTEYDKQWMSTARHLFNVVSTDATNEVSVVTRGVPLATANNYIRLYVDDNFVKTESPAVKLDATLQGHGSLKSTTMNAPQPLRIIGIEKVVNDNIDFTSRYYAYTIPVRNLRKILNYTMPGGVESVAQTIQDSYGSETYQRLTRIVDEIETGRAMTVDKSGADDFQKQFGKLHSNFVAAALNTNLSVSIKQFASYPTAMAYIDAKNLTKALVGRTNIDEIDEHTGAHYKRRLGLSHIEIEAIQKSTKLQDLLDKLPGILNGRSWITTVDCFTTAKIWDAAKYQVNDEIKKTNIKKGSEEYWKRVTDLYNMVLEDTQPMYSVQYRAGIQKSNNILAKTLSMFKTQPLQTFGMIYDALGEYKAAEENYKKYRTEINKNKLKNARKRFYMKAVPALINSAGVFTLMTLLANFAINKTKPWRDDETGEIDILSNLPERFATSMVSMIAPIGGSELYDMINSIVGDGTFYDIESPSLSMINEAYTSIKKIAEYGKSVAAGEKEFTPQGLLEVTENLAYSIAQLKGLELKNISNILKADVYYIGKAFGNTQIENTLGYQYKNSQLYSGYYEALKEGNTEDANRYMNMLEKAGVTYKTIDTQIANRLKEDDQRVTEAAEAYINKDYQAYENLINDIVGDGFKKDVVIKAVKGIVNSMNPKEEKENVDADGEKPLYGTNELYDSMIAENQEEYNHIMEYMLQSKDQKTIDSGIKSKLKNDYLSGSISESKVDTYLKNYLGMTELDAYELKSKWSGKNSYTDLNEAIRTGNMNEAKEYLELLYDRGNGKSVDTIKNAINNGLKGEFIYKYYTNSDWQTLGGNLMTVADYLGLDLTKYEETVLNWVSSSDDYMNMNAYIASGDVQSAQNEISNLYYNEKKDKSTILNAIEKTYKPMYIYMKSSGKDVSSLERMLLSLAVYLGENQVDYKNKIAGWK